MVYTNKGFEMLIGVKLALNLYANDRALAARYQYPGLRCGECMNHERNHYESAQVAGRELNYPFW